MYLRKYAEGGGSAASIYTEGMSFTGIVLFCLIVCLLVLYLMSVVGFRHLSSLTEWLQTPLSKRK